MGSLNSVSLATRIVMESREEIKSSVLKDSKVKKDKKKKKDEATEDKLDVSKRDPNWSQEEVKLLLTSLAENRGEVFLNGNTTKVQQVKKKAWERISSQFPNRSLEKIKSKYEQLKSNSKKRRAQVKSVRSQTGRGQEPDDLEMLDID